MRETRSALDCTEAITKGSRMRDGGERRRFALFHLSNSAASCAVIPGRTEGGLAAEAQSAAFAESRPADSRCANPPRNDESETLPHPAAAGDDLFVQLLVDDVDGAVDFGVGAAELMRDQLHQEIDALDEGGAAGHRTRRR